MWKDRTKLLEKLASAKSNSREFNQNSQTGDLCTNGSVCEYLPLRQGTMNIYIYPVLRIQDVFLNERVMKNVEDNEK